MCFLIIIFQKKKSLSPRSLPFLELGALDHLSRDLLPRATLALRAKASSARAELFSAVEASAAAAGLLEGAAASLERGVPSIPIPVPVFASLGLPALAGCFRRAASAQREELERVRRRAVSAADAAVAEWRREGGATTGRKKTSTPSNHVSSTSSSSSSASSSEAVERLRSRLTVVIAAWKLQALLGPGAPEGGKAAVGAAGAGVAAELAAVAAEMEGF